MIKDNISNKVKRSFSRNVISLLGIPIDLHSLDSLSVELQCAVKENRTTFLSTPNLNFLLLAKRDSEFKQSLIESDLVSLDGMAMLWVARMLGISNVDKVSGSNLFEHMQRKPSSEQLSVFLFGGAKRVAKKAHAAINQDQKGIRSVGYLNPGVGSAGELSKPEFIKYINDSHADFLILSLGAKKGQKWALDNKYSLTPSIICHLGAVLGFAAGDIERAPRILQRIGAEWLWRIKEEPYLFRRYWLDGLSFVAVVMTTLVPYALYKRRYRCKTNNELQSLTVKSQTSNHLLTIEISGPLVKANLSQIRSAFMNATKYETVHLNLQKVSYIDEYGFAQLLLLEKHVINAIKIIKAPPQIIKAFTYENLNHMLACS